MSWLKRTSDGLGYRRETNDLPATGTAYSSAIKFLNVVEAIKAGLTSFVISILVSATAVSGTNVDIGLYGAMSESGTKFLLLDAPVADITNASKTAGGVVNLLSYPAPIYFIGWTVDASETANDITVDIFAPIIDSVRG